MSKGLGRGLDALFGGSETIVANDDTGTILAIDLLSPNPYQPRRFFDKEALAELAASISAQGIIQPLLVRPHSMVPTCLVSRMSTRAPLCKYPSTA